MAKCFVHWRVVASPLLPFLNVNLASTGPDTTTTVQYRMHLSMPILFSE